MTRTAVAPIKSREATMTRKRLPVNLSMNPKVDRLLRVQAEKEVRALTTLVTMILRDYYDERPQLVADLEAYAEKHPEIFEGDE